MAIFGAVGAYMLVQRERDSFERAALDRVRALMTAIDAELRASITPLEMLARSPALDGDDLAAFRVEAQRALEARRGDWSNIVVSHPDTAQMMLNLLVPPGAPLFKTLDPASVIEVSEVRTSDHWQCRHRRRTESAAVHRACARLARWQGEVRPVCSCGDPVIGGLVDRQRFPGTWAVAVLDGSYGFVVRRPDTGKGLRAPSESLKRALDSAPQGFQRGQLLDGSEIYRAFQRSSLSRWSASIAVPRSVVEQSLNGVYVLRRPDSRARRCSDCGSRGGSLRASRSRSQHSRGRRLRSDEAKPRRCLRPDRSTK